MSSTAGIMLDAVVTGQAVTNSEVSKRLYAGIDWEELIRNEVLRRRDHAVLDRAQENLSSVLENISDARDFVRILVLLANQSTNVRVLNYVFTRMEEVLGLSTEKAVTSLSKKRAALFSTNGVQLSSSDCFLKALLSQDPSVQRGSALCFACLLAVLEEAAVGDIERVLSWVAGRLESTADAAWEVGMPALNALVCSESLRPHLLAAGVVQQISAIAKNVGVSGNAQQLYELSFVLWALSLHRGEFSSDGSAVDIADEDKRVAAFLSSGVISLLVELVAAAPTRKVVRMALAVLSNLAATDNDNVLNEMLTTNLLKQLENMSHNNFPKQASDEEVERDFKYLHDTLVRNYRELSSFERWSSEVTSGALRWGILHKEKFWRENARFVDAENFKLLKAEIELLKSADPVIVCVALYDIGEFTRFYPNGRVVVSRLGAKDQIMQMMASDHPDIQKHTLQCISKIMVQNWEFLR